MAGSVLLYLYRDNRLELLTIPENSDTPVSPIKAGLGCSCPRCGQGKLFGGFLDIAQKCDQCGLEYTDFDSGDGPAVFIILIMGFIIVGFAISGGSQFSSAILASCNYLGPLDPWRFPFNASTNESCYGGYAVPT